MDNNIVSQARAHMEKSFEVLRDDFATVKTGKANPQMVENIIINAYNGTARLKVMELTTIHVQDPQTIVLTPFDQSVLGDIERGIMDSQMGIAPVIDGQIIRVSIPPLTQERREEFVKLIHKKAENGRIMLRQVRQDAKDDIKKLEEAGHISEDDVERLEREVQKATDEFIEKIDIIKGEKEKELMTV